MKITKGIFLQQGGYMVKENVYICIINTIHQGLLMSEYDTNKSG